MIARRLSPIAIAPILLLLAALANRGTPMGTGMLWAAGTIVLIAVIEIPLVLYVLARRRKATQAPPPAALFAASASQVGYLAGAVSGPPSRIAAFGTGSSSWTGTA